MSKIKFRSVGECMAELQQAKEGLYSLAFGGDTLNTCWYVRALTSSETFEVEYVTALGSDRLSRDLQTFLGGNGIGTGFVRAVPDRNIGLYLITLDGAERSFTYWRNNSAARLLAHDPEHLAKALSGADIVYFSGITLAILSEADRGILFTQLKKLRSDGVTIAFDSNTRPKLWASKTEMQAATMLGYQAATIALPTFSDEQALFDDASITDCAARIASYGVAEVMVKNGADAVLGLVNGKAFEVTPALVERLVDTTGAGDSFNAGYLVARTRNLPPAEACRYAHQVAGKVISHRGALAPTPLFADMR
ncbi:sugar kinase [Aestuariivirga litoralis]|uniref:sugar kinase n=1 Tax=Aestuariivirga litoralis TaxID=2650924 RepID=UPI0024869276|nr:sugar kinase [Aestuariivirga litoralis]MBG1230754.1 sugar kinase [Aestuariivirga litoralis]